MAGNRQIPLSLLAVTLGLVAACASPPAAESMEASTVEVEVEGSAAAEKVAPDFELEDLDGAIVRLSDSAGQVRLIDFWATWCAPCRDEIPMLKELHAGYAERGLTILAISDESAKIVRPFAAEHGVEYTNLVGGDEIFTEYGALGLPTAYLVDRNGRIVDTYFGPKPRKVLERRIRELLELPPPT